MFHHTTSFNRHLGIQGHSQFVRCQSWGRCTVTAVDCHDPDTHRFQASADKRPPTTKTVIATNARNFGVSCQRRIGFKEQLRRDEVIPMSMGVCTQDFLTPVSV